MTKTELIDGLANKLGVNKSEAEKAINIILEDILVVPIQLSRPIADYPILGSCRVPISPDFAKNELGLEFNCTDVEILEDDFFSLYID